MKVDGTSSRYCLKKNGVLFVKLIPNFVWLHTILHAAPHHSIRHHFFSLDPKILTQLHSVPLFVKPITWLHFALEPHSLALEICHLALFSNQSPVPWRQSCGTQLLVFDFDSKIKRIPESCWYCSLCQFSSALCHAILLSPPPSQSILPSVP